jgi:hypothetical protein
MMQYIAMNPPLSCTKEMIKKAKAITYDPNPIMTLNPILSAILIPNDRTDIVIIPSIGKMIDMKLSVTVLSFSLIHAAT